MKVMDKIICWRGTDGDVKPVKCICDGEFGYPYWCTDEEGKHQQMCSNTHFLNQEDAWKSIVGSVKAWVTLSGRSVKNAMAELQKAKDDSAEAVSAYHDVWNNSDNPFKDSM